MKVLILGPAYPLRGGLAAYTERLCRAFLDGGHDAGIVSYKVQYPELLFPGKTQYADGPAPEGIPIRSLIHSYNPFNWIRLGLQLKKERPDIIVVRYWLPFMGPALGTILRLVRRNQHTRVVCIADNVIPHERRPGDRLFTRYFLKACDAFVTMSDKVMGDLRLFEKDKPARKVLHPLYDNFGEAVEKSEARRHLGLPQDGRIALFFGFIRKYKGLDLLLEAMSREEVRSAGITLLIAGEFYDDEEKYRQQIDRLGIAGSLILRTDFIPNEEVRYYLCAADVVVQPYRNATQSGVTPWPIILKSPWS